MLQDGSQMRYDCSLCDFKARKCNRQSVFRYHGAMRPHSGEISAGIQISARRGSAAAASCVQVYPRISTLPHHKQLPTALNPSTLCLTVLYEPFFSYLLIFEPLKSSDGYRLFLKPVFRYRYFSSTATGIFGMGRYCNQDL